MKECHYYIRYSNNIFYLLLLPRYFLWISESAQYLDNSTYLLVSDLLIELEQFSSINVMVSK